MSLLKGWRERRVGQGLILYSQDFKTKEHYFRIQNIFLKVFSNLYKAKSYPASVLILKPVYLGSLQEVKSMLALKMIFLKIPNILVS